MPKCPSCQQDVSLDHERCPVCGALLADGGRKELENELRGLLEQGRKIEAIKLYRERTGTGLREAKDAVEALQAGAALPSRNRLDPNLEQNLVVLLERGKKIDAIKEYREATGAGLKEAKDAVEALSAEYGLTSVRAGCMGLLAMLAILLGVLAGSI